MLPAWQGIGIGPRLSDLSAATWVAMIALQVGVGHGLLDKTAPSAAAEPVAPQSVLLNVCITWDF